MCTIRGTGDLRVCADGGSSDVGLVPSGGQLGQADQYVEAEVLFEHVFELAAFNDFDPAAVPCGEVAAGFAESGSGDQYSLGSIFVLHDSG